MLQFENQTPFAGTIYLMPDADGIDSMFAVVKGTFTLEERPRLVDPQAPIVLADEYYDDPARSSIKVPSDVSLAKPGTDVVLMGHAYAPSGRPAPWMDVLLLVGPLRKAVRVFGDRFWRSAAVGTSITPPEPFETMPLVWERAFGGADETKDGLSAESRNPIGQGYRASKSEQPVHGLRLPNLEDPYAPIESLRQRPTPACFAPVAAHWDPRRSFAGTYDEAWQKKRAPFLPEDFDGRFFQIAPHGLSVDGCMTGGEQIEVRGVTPAGGVRARVPVVRLTVTFIVDGKVETRPANLDTVQIMPDNGQLILTWRAAMPCDKKALKISAIRAALAQAA